MVKHAIFEIGTEEIPASYITPALSQMTQKAGQFLSGHGLAFGEIKTYATPRRLALLIESVAEKSEDRVDEMLGPAVKVGRDAQGNFTMAAKGFAARHGIEAEKLKTKQTDKGDYFVVQKKTPGEKAEKLLKTMFDQILAGLSFPKAMQWEPSGFRFARPLRTVVALYGEKALKVSVAGVKAGNWTHGIHTLTRKKIIIHSAERYLTTLRNNCILADPAERKATVKKALDTSVRRLKATVPDDDALLEEVTNLIEHPVAIAGRFDEKYLALPQEILITCMKKKQKYFPVYSEAGLLSNNFIGIRNGVSENQEIVREGYERVLAARLADAEFFFAQDTRTPLERKIPKLSGVLLHEKLGSIGDKVERIKAGALAINEKLPAPVDGGRLQKAAGLCKADLVTEMVFEYPELQGVVGRLYAQKEGQPADVADAIEQHYWPVTADGALPGRQMGVILSLADKIDTLIADFAIGLIPTGSADPYGLRRAAIGVLRILREKNLPLSLRALVTGALGLLPANISSNKAAAEQLLEFLRQRMENIFISEGFRVDEVRAVTAAGADDVIDVARRLDALRAIRKLPEFEPLAGAFKRAANLLKQAQKMQIAVPDAVSSESLSEEAEKGLYGAVRQMESDIRKFQEQGEYPAALQKMVSLKPVVDGFFEKIMVMSDDAVQRANRLALLKYTAALFSRILDFSLLQQ